MTQKTINQHGGRRNGAGRRVGKQTKQFTIRLWPDDVHAFYLKAKDCGCTLAELFNALMSQAG